MEIAVAGIGFAVAAVCAVLMGYAIQRGATCLVAAVDEITSRRRAHRLLAMLEASVWVAGGLIVARAFGLATAAPGGFAVTFGTVLGGVLLGLGALINRACVFGAIARFGSGDWAYLLTPLGFFLGCLAFLPWASAAAPVRTELVSPVLTASALLAIPFAGFALWRLTRTWRAAGRQGLAAHVWAPHQATVVIGLTFVLMALIVGPWAYTEALAGLARGMTQSLAARLILVAALAAGAILGGWTAGRLRRVTPTPAAMARCLAGGAMMGAGGMLVPGSNDGLILVGLPLFQPHAIVALAVMALSIAGGQIWLRRRAPS